jgi:Ca2+-binding EF-hand superfamily protein
VGAHERKLAWQISGGGFEALEEAEKWIRRMDRNGDSYLSGKQLAAALREAGYDLTDGDVQLVLNGFGSDEYGRVDVEEFLQAMQDIASGNDWYHKNHRIPGLSKTTSALAEPPSVARSGEFMHGTVFNGLAGGYEGKWDSFDAAREPSLVESALKEVIEQMALIDVSRLPGYGNGNRAAAIMHPFRHMDRGRKGVISISDFAACVEALGLVLTAGEVRSEHHKEAHENTDVSFCCSSWAPAPAHPPPPPPLSPSRRCARWLTSSACRTAPRPRTPTRLRRAARSGSSTPPSCASCWRRPP